MEIAYRSFLAAVEREGERLATMEVAMLGASVPTIEGWTVERVIRHVGKVHRWVTGLLNAAQDADPDVVARAAPSLPRGPDCLEAYRDALGEMCDALASRTPEEPVASFLGTSTAGFWARRQAHEVAVHRVDAADACGVIDGTEPQPIESEIAADGVAEWLEVFVATRHASLHRSLPEQLMNHTIAFAPILRDAVAKQPRWLLHYDGREPVVRDGVREPGEATIREDAMELFLTVWRRRPVRAETVTGDISLVEALIDTMRF